MDCEDEARGPRFSSEPTPEEIELAELRHAAKEKIAAAADLTPAEVDAVLGSNGDPVPGA